MKATAFLLCLFVPAYAVGQTDPGPRPYSGAPWPLLPYIGKVFTDRATDGRAVFSAEWSVTGESGTITNFGGLGPRFDALACASCHDAPTALGGSPATNKQVADATAHGASNTVPSFITSNGPSGLPYVISNQTVGTVTYKANSPLPMFTIAGRSDAPGCSLAQPPLSTLAGNLVFHQALPLWGDGLVETVSMSALAAAQAANAGSRASGLGITLGVYNSGTLGQKGNQISLDAFDATSVELGVTTREFPRERDDVSSCSYNALPEDDLPEAVWQPASFGFHSWHRAQFDLSADFIRASAPPTPACVPASGSSATCYTSSAVGTVTAGQVFIGGQQFVAAGCDVCHTPSLTAGPSMMGALVQGQVFWPWSDYGLHNMGTKGDGITLGSAGPSQMKTTPLWGLGYKIDFWHDGSTKDLAAAIALHSSTGSEGSTSVTNYNAMTTTQKQDILNWLRNL